MTNSSWLRQRSQQHSDSQREQQQGFGPEKKGKVNHRAQSNSLTQKIYPKQQLIQTGTLTFLLSCVSTIHLLLYLFICKEGICIVMAKLQKLPKSRRVIFLLQRLLMAVDYLPAGSYFIWRAFKWYDQDPASCWLTAAFHCAVHITLGRNSLLFIRLLVAHLVKPSQGIAHRVCPKSCL